MQKIAFWRSIAAAYIFVFTQPLRLLRTGGIWLAILALYALWLALSGTAARPTSMADALRHSGFDVAVGLFYLFGLVSFAVAWHRAALLGEDRWWFAALRFRRREWRFLGNGLLIALALGVPLVLCTWFLAIMSAAILRAHVGASTAMLMVFGGPAVLSAATWAFACRLLLVFPALAIDASGDPIADIWQRSRGNWLRLYFAPLTCALPLWLLGSMLSRVTATTVFKYTWALGAGAKLTVSYGDEFHTAVGYLADLLQYAVLMAFYSIAYLQLPAQSAASSAPAPQPAE